MFETLPYRGQFFALLTAIIWSLAVILFKRSGETVHPVALNLFKNSLALVLIPPTMYLLGRSFFIPVSQGDYLLMLASGALGIGIADTMFFRSLNLLGAGLSAIVDCLYSPFIIGLSIVWLGERLTVWQGVGAAIIVTAVLTATHRGAGGSISRRDIITGVAWGVGAMAFMAVGIVMVKPLLERTPLLWATEVRLIGGSLSLLVILALHPARRQVIQSARIGAGWRYMLPGSFIGAYLAIITWLAGMKYAPASIASALNQTSNVFIFLFAALLLKEPIDRRKTLGIALAFAGALFVTFA